MDTTYYFYAFDRFQLKDSSPNTIFLMILLAIRILSMTVMIIELIAVGEWTWYLLSLVPGLESRTGQECYVGRALQ
jgi:hypothetical protein